MHGTWAPTEVDAWRCKPSHRTGTPGCRMFSAACSRLRADRSQHGPLSLLSMQMPCLSAPPAGLCSQQTMQSLPTLHRGLQLRAGKLGIMDEQLLPSHASWDLTAALAVRLTDWCRGHLEASSCHRRAAALRAILLKGAWKTQKSMLARLSGNPRTASQRSQRRSWQRSSASR